MPATVNTPIITIKNLSLSYVPKHQVLTDINLQIKRGELVGIIGANGSGKSSLLKCLAGLNKNYSGSVMVKSQIGFVAQTTELANNFPATVMEVVISGTIGNHPQRIFAGRDDHARAQELLEKMGLAAHAGDSFWSLSGGQRQRALIARALCSQAGVYLFDEPANHLDKHTTKNFYDLMQDLHQHQSTIIIVGHDIEHLLPIATRIIMLESGRIVADAPAKTFAATRRAKC